MYALFCELMKGPNETDFGGWRGYSGDLNSLERINPVLFDDIPTSAIQDS